MEHLQYVIEDSTIAYLLGVNNFTNDESAILELVKNSYDAGALHVNISFSGDQLVIADDGQGMDENNIRTAWIPAWWGPTTRSASRATPRARSPSTAC